ncbi:MAG: GNAT family N-acetyltransferase [Ramlibacter sp.]|nr:GNAT family N-acetyltransferase [Ramlibacter sp.]
MQTLRADDLVLTPLVVAHAQAMFDLLSEPGLYRYLDYAPPPTVEHLREVYARVEKRKSPDGTQCWLNWIVSHEGEPPLGYVQVTIFQDSPASIGYVFSSQHWGRGYATRAMQAVLDHLPIAYGITQFTATTEVANARSIGVLQRLGFREASEAQLAGHHLSPTERKFFR